MKKVFVLLLTISMFVGQTAPAASILSSTAPVTTEPTIALPNGASVTPSQLLTMSPKEFSKLTGKKMGLLKSLAFKAAQKKMAKSAAKAGDKSQLIALLLCAFVGGIGIHRFYLGYTWQGIVQLLTLGGLGIWTLIDFVRIIMGTLKPKNGEYNPSL
jgi:TM2 domain-containing membrane protein YozV